MYERWRSEPEDVLREAWGEDALAKVERALERSPKRARVLFDFDNTIVRGDFGDVALLALLEDDVIVRPSHARWGPLTSHAHEVIEQAFGSSDTLGLDDERRSAVVRVLAHVLTKERLFDGRAAFEPSITSCCRGSYFAMAALIDALPLEAREALAIRAWESALAANVERVTQIEGHRIERALRPREAMLALRAIAEREGHEVWIVTASHEDLVRTIAPRLGFDPARVIGARPSRSFASWAAVDGAPVMTFDVGKRAHVAHHAEGRAIAEAHGHRPSVAIACGDADTDHAMLEDASGLLVLVDRGQPRVTALAERREREGEVAVIRVAPR